MKFLLLARFHQSDFVEIPSTLKGIQFAARSSLRRALSQRCLTLATVWLHFANQRLSIDIMEEKGRNSNERSPVMTLERSLIIITKIIRRLLLIWRRKKTLLLIYRLTAD